MGDTLHFFLSFLCVFRFSKFYDFFLRFEAAEKETEKERGEDKYFERLQTSTARTRLVAFSSVLRRERLLFLSGL